MVSSSSSPTSSSNSHHGKVSAVIPQSPPRTTKIKTTTGNGNPPNGNSVRRMNGSGVRKPSSSSKHWNHSNNGNYRKNFHYRHSNSNGYRGKNPRSNNKSTSNGNHQQSLRNTSMQTTEEPSVPVPDPSVDVTIATATEKPIVVEIGQQTETMLLAKDVKEGVDSSETDEKIHVDNEGGCDSAKGCSETIKGTQSEATQASNFVVQNTVAGTWLPQQQFQVPVGNGESNPGFTGYQHPVPDYYLEPENSQLIFTPSGLAIPRTNHYMFVQQQIALDEQNHCQQYQSCLVMEQPAPNTMTPYQIPLNGVVPTSTIPYGTLVGKTSLPSASATSTTDDSSPAAFQLDSNCTVAEAVGQQYCGFPGVMAIDGSIYYFHPFADQVSSVNGELSHAASAENGKVFLSGRTKKGNGSRNKNNSNNRTQKTKTVEILRKPALSSLDEFPLLLSDKTLTSGERVAAAEKNCFSVTKANGARERSQSRTNLDKGENEMNVGRSSKKINNSRKKVNAGENKGPGRKNRLNKKISSRASSAQPRQPRVAPQDDINHDTLWLPKQRYDETIVRSEDNRELKATSKDVRAA